MGKNIPPEKYDSLFSAAELREYLNYATDVPRISLETRERLRVIEDVINDGSAATPEAAKLIVSEITGAMESDTGDA